MWEARFPCPPPRQDDPRPDARIAKADAICTMQDRVTPEWAAALPEDDHRHARPDFRPPQLERNIRIAAGLVEIARESGHTAAQLAIAWTLRRPEVSAPIVGARSPAQIESTAPAGDWVLSTEEIAAVEKLLEEV